MTINLINYALAQKDWKKAYEDLKLLEIGGRNLLLGTSKDEIEFSFSNFNGPAHRVTDDKFEEILKGGDYTASVEITELDAVGTDLALMFSYRSSTGSSIRQIISPMRLTGNQTGRIVFTTELAPLDLDSDVAYIEVHLRNTTLSGLSKGKYREMKLEKGNRASDWTPAPEDINAHPFVAELAETVYRSKQNEERIQNLENAITALGGGS